MRYLLYLPGIILLLLPILRMRHAAKRAEQARREQEAERAAAAEQRRIEAERKKAIQERKAAEREATRVAREAEQQRKQAARLEAARQRAEYAERELAARREAKALELGEIIPDTSEHVTLDDGPEEPIEPLEYEDPEQHDTNAQSEPEPVSVLELLKSRVKGNNAFVGHTVAFTGRLPGMTRREAIQAVQDNGGRAYTKMPAGTTLLVVGDKPGMCKMDKADEWIGQVRKITAAQFFAMLEEPLNLELDELEALITA